MKKIQFLQVARLHNAECFQFYNRVLAYLNSFFVDQYKLERLFAPFIDLYHQFEDIYNDNHSSLLTNELKVADKARDNQFIGTKQMISSFERFGTEAEKEAALVLSHVLKPYKEALRKSMMKNSGEIRSFIADMTNSANAGYVTTLNLESRIAELENLNEAFDDIYFARESKKLSAKESAKLIQIRKDIDTAYRNLAEKINALYVIAYDEEDDAVKDDLGMFIENINAIVQTMQHSINVREGRKHSTEEEQIITSED